MRQVVYTAESPVRHPGALLREMAGDLRASWPLASRLMVRNIRAQYQRSFLGFAWAFLPAAATAAILSVVRGVRDVSVGDMTVPYPLYVVLSMTLWQLFLEVLQGPLQAFLTEKPLLFRSANATDAVVLAKVGEAAFGFVMRSLLTAALLLWYQVPLTGTALLAPAGAVALMLFGTALGLLLAPWSLLYEDIVKSLPVVTMLWFFSTPVLYPSPSHGPLATLVALNPVAHLIVTTQELLLGQTLSFPWSFAIVVSVAVAALFAGWVLCRLILPLILERAKP
jgi:lipopolysaccharide transport system permease protein